jgi:superoxide dismutase, Fe-Mn family
MPQFLSPEPQESLSVCSRRSFLEKSLWLTAGGGMLSALTGGVHAQQSALGCENSIVNPKYSANPESPYTLPVLPYAYNALEPHIDEKTMHLHHDVHFLSYVNGLNEALDALKHARSKNDFKFLSYWENQLAFHGSGYVLHRLFFDQMAPVVKCGTPSKELSEILTVHFGSLDAFKAQFSTAANQVQGSGWAILAYQPLGQRLIILQAEKHQNLTQWNVEPLLALDVWEHAYYLEYQNKRADYVKSWWNVVDWAALEVRVIAAMA